VGRLFAKVLIANRGEIAVRVIRACRELGIATVAVFSDADAGALHVRLADEAVPLGGLTAAESYLNTAAILAAVASTGADAVHPGYGFFSENAEFARAVAAAGAVFIGPPAAAIAVMGDKLTARQAAASAGVAGVPGTVGALASAAEVVAFGDAHGWPVAIKAAFGGGGRGIRVVDSADAAAGALASAQSEALSSFGRAECYVEKYLSRPRHIEMQILADAHGNCVWLGERDCSVQRRHQKLIEETPAPDFPDSVRTAMGDAAVRVARACGYVNAGTVEFLYQEGEFWFLEMNTRLQVEHPITELTTGLDLVAEQLRVAAGEPLRFGVVQRRGHAMECRINAEDPAGGRFLPSPGAISALRVPQGFGVRWDGGYEAGDEVSPYYDNLVGKLVVWGEDRAVAVARMRRALGELHIAGIATTAPAHLAVLRHPDFLAARQFTRWVENELDLGHLVAQPSVPAVAPEAPEHGGRCAEVCVGGRWYAVPRFGGSSAREPRAVEAGPPRAGNRSTVAAARPSSGSVASQMQGTVVKVLVGVGDRVAVGDPVCVMEAMKMEVTLAAERAGPVVAVHVTGGQAVRPGDVLVVIGEGAA
jgi:acetyl-CoA/propionyl-CoA carboxylase biotin carboxyl carrier protein